MNMKIHPTTIVDSMSIILNNIIFTCSAGYILASTKASEYLTSLACIPPDLKSYVNSEAFKMQNNDSIQMDPQAHAFLRKIASTSLSSKSIGSFSDHFVPLGV